MKNFLFLGVILFLGTSLFLKTYSQEKTNEVKKETVEQQSDLKTQVEDGKPVNTVCPVSTEDVDPEITYTYKGKTYALCCNNCLKKFKKDPEKYISKLSEDGKSIKKKD